MGVVGYSSRFEMGRIGVAYASSVNEVAAHAFATHRYVPHRTVSGVIWVLRHATRTGTYHCGVQGSLGYRSRTEYTSMSDIAYA